MRNVYLDHSATTYLAPQVKKAMEPFWIKEFGNPSAIYELGRRAKKAIDESRNSIAQILNCKSNEIIFTGSGTESDNLAIFGVVNGLKDKISFKPHIITSKIEHPAVLEAFKELERQGIDTTFVGIDKDGFVDLEVLKRSIRPETILVSIMYANNEIGTIQPIKEISKIITKVKGKNGFPYFHTDACQAAGYFDLDVNSLGVDLLTINASKIYGPKGIGLLYVKQGISLKSILFGGGQEFGIRSSTESVPLIIGLARALELVQGDRIKESKRLIVLRNRLIKDILKLIPNSKLNGGLANRLPNNINISFRGVEGESLVLYLDKEGIYASTGSACSSKSLEPSYVILALGEDAEIAHGSLRMTLGKCNTGKDIKAVLEILPKVINKIRKLSIIK